MLGNERVRMPICRTRESRHRIRPLGTRCEKLIDGMVREAAPDRLAGAETRIFGLIGNRLLLDPVEGDDAAGHPPFAATLLKRVAVAARHHELTGDAVAIRSAL